MTLNHCKHPYGNSDEEIQCSNVVSEIYANYSYDRDIRLASVAAKISGCKLSNFSESGPVFEGYERLVKLAYSLYECFQLDIERLCSLRGLEAGTPESKAYGLGYAFSVDGVVSNGNSVYEPPSSGQAAVGCNGMACAHGKSETVKTVLMPVKK